MNRYLIIIEDTATGYSAYSPDLPGCVSTACTREEVEREMHDAIDFTSTGCVPRESRFRNLGLRPLTAKSPPNQDDAANRASGIESGKPAMVKSADDRAASALKFSPRSPRSVPERIADFGPYLRKRMLH